MTIAGRGGPGRIRLRSGAALAGSAVLTVVACAVVARLETIARVADEGGLLGPTLAPLAILPLGTGWPFRMAAGLIFGLGLIALLRAAVRRTVGAGDVPAAVAAALALIGIVVAAGLAPADGSPSTDPWFAVLLGEIGRSILVLTWALAAVFLVGWRRRAVTAAPRAQPSGSGSGSAGGGTATLPVIDSPDDRSTKQ